ncbi:MAG: hypothetical protein C4584_00345 [Armatimonadetes bacterium]|nr:MAG: hypothetical protein C4584_00345 [Armatimonadota bacterium]
MTKDDLNQIRGVVREEIDTALEPIKGTLNDHTKILTSHTKILDDHTKILTSHTKILDDHTKILTSHTKILDDHTQKLDALWDQTVKLTEDTEEIKETLKSHKNNLTLQSDNIVKVDKRLTEVEGHLGVVAPPELSIIR